MASLVFMKLGVSELNLFWSAHSSIKLLSKIRHTIKQQVIDTQDNPVET